MKKFQLLDKVKGYVSKVDKTNAPEAVLVPDSQNVLINDGEKVATRGGYTIFGAAGSGSAPIESSYDWQTSTNTTLNLRGYDDELEVYVGTVEAIAFNAWERVADSWTAVDFSFAPWWSATELFDELLFVNGLDKIQEWSGGLTTYASCTANTITKQTTTNATWGNARFLTTGTTKVKIKDSSGTWREFTYTGGEGTATLTGVTPDPTAFTFAAGALVMQSVRENDNQPIDGATNDFIAVNKNQVYLGSITRNQIYISKDTNFLDYTFSSPRVPGEGALLILDSVGRGFMPLQGNMFMSAGRDDWYKTKFEQITVGTALAETLSIVKLKTSPGLAAQSNDLISGDMFVSFEPKLRRVLGVDDNDNLITEDLSDPIKPDFDIEDFTGGHIKKHRNRTYICSPVNSIVWINEVRTDINGQETRFWQPPQILPIRRFAIIGDLIYGHSSGFEETYKLFDGTNDNGNPISFNASYSYRNFGDRAMLKKFDQWLTEGYIRGNTIITHQLRYDFQGSEQTLEKEINGSDDGILFDVVGGMTPLGITPLGIQTQATQQPKFRQISEFAPRDFFEIQSIYYSSAVDDQWEIVAQGPNATRSTNQSVSLTR